MSSLRRTLLSRATLSAVRSNQHRVFLSSSLCRSYAVATAPAQKPAIFGQPTHLTHPHLIAPDEVTPGISKEEYRERRRRLMDAFESDDTVVVCLAGTMKYASGDIFYKFRQASDFWYLTGLQETHSALVLVKDPSSPQGHTSTLFLRPKHPHEELWQGPRTGLDLATSLFSVDQSLDISEFPNYLRSVALATPQTEVYASNAPGDSPAPSTKAFKRRRSWSNYLGRAAEGMMLKNHQATYDSVMMEVPASRLHPLALRLAGMRSVKSEAEQKLMKRAGEVSGDAHAKTMRFTKPGQSEGALAAHFEYLCALEGSQRPAYVPVVASGPNALTIHYTSNDQIMRDGELVLMDAGCELQTWPVNGTFTPAQRDLYSAVLSTLKTCTTMCTESSGVTMYDIHRRSTDILRRELKQLSGWASLDLSQKDLDRLYPHFVSHGVGIDLHESSDGRSRSLQDGMVVTIEPGLYVPPDPAFPKAFHDIGIRLEDEVLVKKDHFVRLSVNAPLEIEDVEGTCQGLLGVGPY
ncbi:hypothetical protein FRB97_006130 [Tulasnella sp. 331]|nr:hypothetical protein FRB97_006130 [Tulasnella sp. 331]